MATGVRPIGFEMMEEGINVNPQPTDNIDTSPLVEPNNVPIGFEDQANPAYVADEPNRNNNAERPKVHKVSFNVDPKEGEVTGGPRTRVAKDGTEEPDIGCAIGMVEIEAIGIL
ncbi:hypothetical protein LOTGIDRAFT_154378 [Lottia gigantea]|uniref:Uncharacterized protein n=1 Tax=Lottia gigantea TaxID=225164 RepID=V3ZXY8_LOTGI|nr:hypothetical protein LOTGIDRAFT_154378 [Lottia gigantea]ESO89282.1 hypothetical protein LOTGIDRAFT_154378 [Lottia gigantea]